MGVVLALQVSNAVHLGVDNLNVVRHVGRLLDGVPSLRPLELEDDGDLIGLFRKMLSARGEGTEGYAGQVRELDRDGNGRADEAADSEANDLAQTFLEFASDGTRMSGISIVFFIAISRTVVNADDYPGIAPDHLIRSDGEA